MKVWAISDTHLSSDPEKDMSVFGDNWKYHAAKITDNWERLVGENDVVLIPGDICWATSLGNGIRELRFFESLPGEKVFIKGNHDYWWDSISKVRKLSPPRTHFIQNDIVTFGNFGIGGTRLWAYDFIKWPCVARNLELDGKTQDKPEVDQNWLKKVRNRELTRLELSLCKIPDNTFKIAMVHFPPIDEDGNENVLTNIMSNFKIDLCVFGHLHAVTGRPAGVDIVIGTTRYVLVSADFVGFSPLLLR